MKYSKLYYENGSIIQPYSDTIYGMRFGLGKLHRIDGLAIEHYNDNYVITNGSYYIYGSFIGKFQDNPKFIKKKIDKLLKQKIFE